MPAPPPEPAPTPEPSATPLPGGLLGGGESPARPSAPAPDPFPGHTISAEGARAHESWAAQLPRDSDPRQTARMLKTAIDTYGDQGRADVADLLGRFHQHDAGKAATLRKEMATLTGETLPFRVAPLGEGFRAPTDAERLSQAPKAPFGSPGGADAEGGNRALGSHTGVRCRKKHQSAPKRNARRTGRKLRDASSSRLLPQRFFPKLRG
ncbi:hypothetical protein [Magnetospirillum sp. UT-4]|uniref:hypothetical protein n=1 Tax=Magnetospirillum sp. UT-4 TaxID=2681467 RepID=UPI00137D6FE3|nr:hypothetical protein [Magnetospirillum sp. UT-4]CAA7614270.1 hypothetical protein MTBUT4_180050 [Magnetospirillum sp. UT-4]